MVHFEQPIPSTVDRPDTAAHVACMAKVKRPRVKGYVATRPEQVPGDLLHPARQAEMAAAMAVQGERPERPELDTSTGSVEKRRMKSKPRAKAKPKTAAIKRKSPARKSSGSARSGGITAAMTSKRMPGQPPKSHR